MGPQSFFASLLVAASIVAQDFPVPPPPPANPPVDEAAPVPNVDARAPVLPSSEQPSIDVKLYRAQPYNPSQGFAPGSQYQSNEDRKPIQTPGLSVSVPLQ
jgi:hypothetical protein